MSTYYIDDLIPYQSDHVVTINVIGWGEPPEFYTTCSCGWQGITIETPYAEPVEDGIKHLIEPYRSIASTYGMDSILPDGHAFGHREDAIRQALNHLDYDPTADHAETLRGLIDATQRLQDALQADTTDEEALRTAGTAVAKATTAFSTAVERRRIWEAGPVPVLPTRHPEAIRLLAEARTNKPT